MRDYVRWTSGYRRSLITDPIGHGCELLEFAQEPLCSGEAKSVGQTIDESTIRERVLSNTATVTAWLAARLMVDGEAIGHIDELYTDYAAHCRRESCPPLTRKTWIAAMKLAGFETESGAFPGLRIR